MADSCLSADSEYAALAAEAFANVHVSDSRTFSTFDLTLRLILADWLEDQGRHSEADCLRWAAMFEPVPRHPYHNYSRWTWMSPVFERDWAELWSALPTPLFDALTADGEANRFPGYKAYNSVAEAFDALLAAWPVALAKGWRPEGPHV